MRVSLPLNSIHNKKYGVRLTSRDFFSFDYLRELGVEKDLGYVKDVVNKEYTVVGTLEKMSETLDLLETTVPQFFKGIKDIYYKKRVLLFVFF
jgi:hypothetical protein